MPKKVFELANEIGMGAIELVEKLKDMGMNVRNHMVALSDEEVAKAMEAFAGGGGSSSEKKASASKVVKKTAKKKVVKKVIKKTQASEEETENAEVSAKVPSETPEEVAVEAKPTKTVVVKKQTVDRRKAEAKENREQEALGEEVRASKASEEDSSDDSDKEIYKPKMHSFTPVFIPEDEKKSSSDDDYSDDDVELKPKKKSKPNVERTPEEILAEGTDEDRKKEAGKKRMGDLAAAVAKKGGGVASKAKDLTTIRAEEELKLASTIVGSTIYTPVKRKKIYTGDTKQTEITEVKDSKRVVNIHDAVTASDLAGKLSQKFESLANKALELNLLLKQDDWLGLELATELAALYSYRVENKAFDEDKVIGKDKKEDKSAFPLRNPIITIMGHVDHGKTTLVDHMRKTKVVEGEAGGITQHVGAYSVQVDGTTLTFLDTPGHAAFASMRQRGANVTDIVVLVVAADDGVMPQTVESIKYAKNAQCPIIIAVNKMDKEGANPDRIKQQLMEFELTPEDWGGDTQYVHISALKGEGIDDLLSAIKVQAEIMELRENPKGAAEGVIIESRVEQGRGPVSTILVQKGTLSKGDAIVVGETFGRARTLTDSTGKNVNEAGPSIPVQILGLNEVTTPGDIVNVVKNEREAKKIVDNRIAERKKLENVDKPKVASLEDFFANASVETGEKKILKLVIRADVQGSFEAIKDALVSLGNDEVGVDVIAGGVGAITDNDVMMAANSGGYILGFNMRPVTTARRMAEDQGVDIKTYSVIYEMINDVTLALEGMLEPEKVEKYIGRAEVRDTFSIPKVGTIAGAAVIDGKIERGCNIRLLRAGKILHDGKLSTLKRFKDEVKEVANGYECGIALEGYSNIHINDIFEAYIVENIKRKLEPSSQTL